MKNNFKSAITLLSLIFIVSSLLVLPASAETKTDFRKYLDPENYRIRVYESWPDGYHVEDDDVGFGVIGVQYDVYNAEGGVKGFKAFEQYVIFSFEHTPLYLRHFGPGREMVEITESFGLKGNLMESEKNTFEAEYGKYHHTESRTWLTKGLKEHVGSYIYVGTRVNMSAHVCSEEDDPMEELMATKKQQMEDSMRKVEDETVCSIEEINEADRTMCLYREETTYAPKLLRKTRDGTTITKFSERERSEYHVFIKKEEFPGIYLYVIVSAGGSCYYQKAVEASGKIDQSAENIYQGYESKLDIAYQVANELIHIEPKVTYLEVVPGRAVNPPGETIHTEADKEAGETRTSIPYAIATIIIGAAAAAIGAGLAEGDKKEKEKKSSYKMCIRKDFGDAIKYDSPSETIYARIVEINAAGEEIDRPDLTAKLEILPKQNLKIEDASMAGNYMGALIYAQSDKEKKSETETGTISIRFGGNEGFFQNDVTFRLIGEAYIEFPERGKELTPTTYMLYGDDGRYRVPIKLQDFASPVEDVELKLPGQQPFTVEVEKIDDQQYNIWIQNTSVLKEETIRSQENFMVEVYAKNEKETAYDYFTVSLLPEGLSLRPFTGCPIDQKGRLQVHCSLLPDQSEEDTEIKRTTFQLSLAISEEDEHGNKRAKMVQSSELDFVFTEMFAENEKLKNLLKAFQYEIDPSEKHKQGTIHLHPKRQLPQDERLEYNVALPVSCEYENQQYQLDIAVLLVGDKLLPMAEKTEEVKILIRRIRALVDPEQRGDLIRSFKDDLPTMSASDVRLLSKSLVYASQAEVYKGSTHLLRAEALDWICWGLDWYVWIGDRAASILIARFAKGYAPMVEAVVMPAKHLICEHLGIWIAEYVSGAPSPSAKLDQEKLERTGMEMLEGMLTGMIDETTTPKKAGFILAVFLTVKTANYYFYEKDAAGEPLGIYGAITAALGDLTEETFKIIIGTKFGQMLKDPAKNKMFGRYVDEFIRKQLPSDFLTMGDGLDFEIVQKYVEETAGLLGAKVYSEAQAAAGWVADHIEKGAFVITLYEDKKNPDQTLKIAIRPEQLGNSFLDYLFDKMFGMLPFPKAKEEVPRDPPYTAGDLA